MRLLYFTKYTKIAASSRLRSYQFFPFLENEGCEITLQPLFNELYLRDIYSRKKPGKINLVLCYLRRFCVLFTVSKYDLVIIEKELFPYFPAIFERIFKLLGIKYVADYDDAIFHNYDRSKVLFINFFLRKKIDYVMKHSAAVIAGNNYLAERAIMANAKKVVIIPTVIDARRYLFNPEGQPKSELVIGWIGSPTTLKYLINLKNVFTSLAEKYSFKLHIIGGGSIGLVNNENVIPWSEETEIAELYKIDIGIMPLINSDWERGKCAYKLIQYMACGKPVVASPVGANLNLVSNSETGYFANTDQEWYDALEVLLLNSEARKEMGKKAAEFIRSNYTIQSISLKHLDIFKTVINSNN